MAVVTSFLVVVHDDGKVTAEQSGDEGLARQASELDIKQACQELIEAIHQRTLVRVISSVMTDDKASKTSRAVRESLVERGYLS
jgi:hypothetical protein